MIEEIDEIIKEHILVNNTKKIKEESLEEYLNGFKKRRIKTFCLFSGVC